MWACGEDPGSVSDLAASVAADGANDRPSGPGLAAPALTDGAARGRLWETVWETRHKGKDESPPPRCVALKDLYFFFS